MAGSREQEGVEAARHATVRNGRLRAILYGTAFGTSVACQDAITPPLAAPEAPAARVEAGPYTPQELGPGMANDIDGHGDIAGSWQMPPTLRTHAVIWIGSTPTDLGAPLGNFSYANAMNDAHTVVGDAIPLGGPSAGFIWRNGTFTYVLPPRTTDVTANDINNSEVVVGSYRTGPPLPTATHAYRYTDAGGLVDIHPAGSTYLHSDALAISDQGVIAGRVLNLTTGAYHVARWDAANNVTDLGVPPGTQYLLGLGINRAGAIVGSASTPTGSVFAFAWTSRGGWRTMAAGTVANDISDAGRVVGTRFGATSRAATWFRGAVAPLPLPPGTTESDARAVNRCGMVAGSASGPTSGGLVRWVPASCD